MSMGDLQRLVEIFPAADCAVISGVLEACSGNFERAMESLLDMRCGDATEPMEISMLRQMEQEEKWQYQQQGRKRASQTRADKRSALQMVVRRNTRNSTREADPQVLAAVGEGVSGLAELIRNADLCPSVMRNVRRLPDLVALARVCRAFRLPAARAIIEQQPLRQELRFRADGGRSWPSNQHVEVHGRRYSLRQDGSSREKDSLLVVEEAGMVIQSIRLPPGGRPHGVWSDAGGAILVRRGERNDGRGREGDNENCTVEFRIYTGN